MDWIVSNPALKKVYDKYGPPVFRRSSMLWGLEKFLKELQSAGHLAGVETCVEIGTHHGLTAILLAQFFPKVVSMDILHDTHKEDCAKIAGANNITFLDLTDNKDKEGWLEKLKFQFAYMDGDHANDTDLDFKLLKKCGKILMHEVWSMQPPVIELVSKLKADGDTLIECDHDCLALWIRK